MVNFNGEDVNLEDIDNMSTDDEDSDDDEAPGMLSNFMKSQAKKRVVMSDFDGFDDGDDNTIVQKMKGVLALRESLGMDDDASFMAAQEVKIAEKKKLAAMSVEDRMRFEEEQAGDVMAKIRARHTEKMRLQALQAPPQQRLPKKKEEDGTVQAPPQQRLPKKKEEDGRLKKDKSSCRLKADTQSADEYGYEDHAPKRSSRPSKSDDEAKPRRNRRASINGPASTEPVEAVKPRRSGHRASMTRGSSGDAPSSGAEKPRRSARRASIAGSTPLAGGAPGEEASSSKPERKLKKTKSIRISSGDKPRRLKEGDSGVRKMKKEKSFRKKTVEAL
jgi:hypothetical protein